MYWPRYQFEGSTYNSTQLHQYNPGTRYFSVGCGSWNTPGVSMVECVKCMESLCEEDKEECKSSRQDVLEANAMDVPCIAGNDDIAVCLGYRGCLRVRSDTIDQYIDNETEQSYLGIHCEFENAPLPVFYETQQLYTPGIPLMQEPQPTESEPGSSRKNTKKHELRTGSMNILEKYYQCVRAAGQVSVANKFFLKHGIDEDHAYITDVLYPEYIECKQDNERLQYQGSICQVQSESGTTLNEGATDMRRGCFHLNSCDDIWVEPNAANGCNTRTQSPTDRGMTLSSMGQSESVKKEPSCLCEDEVITTEKGSNLRLHKRTDVHMLCGTRGNKQYPALGRVKIDQQPDHFVVDVVLVPAKTQTRKQQQAFESSYYSNCNKNSNTTKKNGNDETLCNITKLSNHSTCTSSSSSSSSCNSTSTGNSNNINSNSKFYHEIHLANMFHTLQKCISDLTASTSNPNSNFYHEFKQSLMKFQRLLLTTLFVHHNVATFIGTCQQLHTWQCNVPAQTSLITALHVHIDDFIHLTLEKQLKDGCFTIFHDIVVYAHTHPYCSTHKEWKIQKQPQSQINICAAHCNSKLGMKMVLSTVTNYSQRNQHQQEGGVVHYDDPQPILLTNCGCQCSFGVSSLWDPEYIQSVSGKESVVMNDNGGDEYTLLDDQMEVQGATLANGNLYHNHSNIIKGSTHTTDGSVQGEQEIWVLTSLNSLIEGPTRIPNLLLSFSIPCQLALARQHHATMAVLAHGLSDIRVGAIIDRILRQTYCATVLSEVEKNKLNHIFHTYSNRSTLLDTYNVQDVSLHVRFAPPGKKSSFYNRSAPTHLTKSTTANHQHCQIFSTLRNCDTTGWLFNDNVRDSLDAALDEGNMEMLRDLIDANVFHRSSALYYPRLARCAAKDGNILIVRAVIELIFLCGKININESAHLVLTGLRAYQDEPLLRHIQQLGANPASPISHQVYPIHMSVQKSTSLEICSLLLKHKADVNVRSFDHETPLSLAVKHQLYDTVRLLVEYNANINEFSFCTAEDKGINPLKRACEMGSTTMVELLLQLGATTRDQYQDGVATNLAEISVKNGHINLLPVLKSKGQMLLSLNTWQRGRTTLLGLAAERNDLRSMNELYAYGANPNAPRNTTTIHATRFELTTHGPGLVNNNMNLNIHNNVVHNNHNQPDNDNNGHNNGNGHNILQDLLQPHEMHMNGANTRIQQYIGPIGDPILRSVEAGAQNAVEWLIQKGANFLTTNFTPTNDSTNNDQAVKAAMEQESILDYTPIQINREVVYVKLENGILKQYNAKKVSPMFKFTEAELLDVAQSYLDSILSCFDQKTQPLPLSTLEVTPRCLAKKNNLVMHEPSPQIHAIQHRHNHIQDYMLRFTGSYLPLFTEIEGSGRPHGGSTALIASLTQHNERASDLILQCMHIHQYIHTSRKKSNSDNM